MIFNIRRAVKKGPIVIDRATLRKGDALPVDAGAKGHHTLTFAVGGSLCILDEDFSLAKTIPPLAALKCPPELYSEYGAIVIGALEPCEYVCIGTGKALSHDIVGSVIEIARGNIFMLQQDEYLFVVSGNVGGMSADGLAEKLSKGVTELAVTEDSIIAVFTVTKIKGQIQQ